MNTWLIEPRDPLIARDGRPASTASFNTLRFPFPSTLAGAVRTRMAAGDGPFNLSGAALDELKAIAVEGPLLVELQGDCDEVAHWYAPAPRDTLFERPAGSEPTHASRSRLLPHLIQGGRQMDSLPAKGLLPVGTPPGKRPGKVPPGLPAYWKWEELERWLLDPPMQEVLDLKALGIENLPIERRVHVALRPGERIGLDGALFSTAGLRFLVGPERSLTPRRFALGLRSAGGDVQGQALALVPQMAPLGGERRLARWYPASRNFPQMPLALSQRIAQSKRARLVLLTPACFAQGALPGWSGKPWPTDEKVTVTVRAACVGRPEIVSGWDLAFDNGIDPANGKRKARGRPKETRRLAPAGSVYFVELEGEHDDIKTWCESTWLAPISDALEDRRDGFGLAALGTWEGGEV